MRLYRTVKLQLPALVLGWLLLLSGAGCSADAGKTSAAPAPPGRKTASGPALLHPSFSLVQADLERLTAGLPEGFREKILGDPGRFLDLLERVLDSDTGLLVLVDKTHPLPESYEPEDLVNLKAAGFAVNRDNLELRSVAVGAFRAMVDGARTDGIKLPVVSAYRSYRYQETVYANHVATWGKEAAERESARAGHSQHQLGTVLDLVSLEDGFGETAAGRWLSRNAWRYGFSLSYPDGYVELTGYKYEPWHYRYTGRAAAEFEREYFGGIQQYLLQFLNTTLQEFSAARLQGKSSSR